MSIFPTFKCIESQTWVGIIYAVVFFLFFLCDSKRLVHDTKPDVTKTLIDEILSALKLIWIKLTLSEEVESCNQVTMGQ